MDPKVSLSKSHQPKIKIGFHLVYKYIVTQLSSLFFCFSTVQIVIRFPSPWPCTHYKSNFSSIFATYVPSPIFFSNLTSFSSFFYFFRKSQQSFHLYSHIKPFCRLSLVSHIYCHFLHQSPDSNYNTNNFFTLQLKKISFFVICGSVLLFASILTCTLDFILNFLWELSYSQLTLRQSSPPIQSSPPVLMQWSKESRSCLIFHQIVSMFSRKLNYWYMFNIQKRNVSQ